MVTAIDIIILIIVVYFLIGGVRRGLVRQVLEVVGIIAAFVCAFYLAHNLAAYLGPRLDISHNILTVISAVIIFAGVITGFHFLGLAIRKFLSITLLGSFDRVMGGIFGGIKGLLLCSLLLIVLMALPIPQNFRNKLRNDPVVTYVRPLLPVLFNSFLFSTDLKFHDVIESGDNLMEKAREKSRELRDRSREIKDNIEDKTDRI
ncbi:MAG: CvpA family protein [Candidatus Krumholzibacteriales bacterium]